MLVVYPPMTQIQVRNIAGPHSSPARRSPEPNSNIPKWVKIILNKVPLSATALVLLGLLNLLLSGTLLYWFVIILIQPPWMFSQTYLVASVVTTALTTIFLGAAIMRTRLDRQIKSERVELEKLFRVRVNRLLPALTDTSVKATTTEIAKRSGILEHIVVEVLLELKKRGEVEEELNLETGEFFYRKIDNISSIQDDNRYDLEDRKACKQRT